MSGVYRPCVVAVISDGRGRFLVGERADQKGAWQLPQGGIDPGEDAKIAVLRELREEIGTDAVDILQQLPQRIRYEFPAGFQKDHLKAWIGQEQDWFLMRLQAGAKPDLALSEGEFQALDWREPAMILGGIIEWKRKAYKEGFEAFGLIKG